ncbi:MAG: hypothetical protein RBS38_01195 [Bacteroidales bacterium]|jgi:hypothetical protein|nr:hypothetical protein [Bacteroidales bacterium]
MSQVIIGVHGLGNKPPAPLLEQWWKSSMKEGLRLGKYGVSLPLFEMAPWSDIIHKTSQDPSVKDPESPYFIDEKYTEAQPDFHSGDNGTRKKVVDFIGRQMNRVFLNEDLTLNYSFITDAIISRYFRDLEIYYSDKPFESDGGSATYRELIRKRLLDKLIEHRNDDIMLIGHSMGSIIAFDVLTFMAPEIRINTLVTMGSPLGLPVVISKIAAEMRQKGISDTRLKSPPGVTGNWYNYSDILDTVAFNYRLADYYNENRSGVKPVDHLVVNDYESNKVRNPHKAYGYLRTPRFTAVLNEFISTGKLSVKERIMRWIQRTLSPFRASPILNTD